MIDIILGLALIIGLPLLCHHYNVIWNQGKQYRDEQAQKQREADDRLFWTEFNKDKDS